MALPAGISGKTLTFGTTTGFDGVTIPDGSRVYITTSKNIKHLPTGRQLVSGQIVGKFVGGMVTFNELVPNDAPGLDRYDWTYRATFDIRGAAEQPASFDFALFTNDPQTIDGDLLSPVPSSVGTPVSVTVVRSLNGLTGDVTLTAAGLGAQPTGDYATNTDLTAGLSTKVNSSTYAAGLASKQDASTLGTTVAADPTVRAALVPRPSGGADGQVLVKSGADIAWGTVAGGTGSAPADPVLSNFVYATDGSGNLLSYKEDGVTITLTYNADGTVATSKRGTAAAKTFTYSGGNLAGVA